MAETSVELKEVGKSQEAPKSEGEKPSNTWCGFNRLNVIAGVSLLAVVIIVIAIGATANASKNSDQGNGINIRATLSLQFQNAAPQANDALSQEIANYIASLANVNATQVEIITFRVATPNNILNVTFTITNSNVTYADLTAIVEKTTVTISGQPASVVITTDCGDYSAIQCTSVKYCKSSSCNNAECIELANSFRCDCNNGFYKLNATTCSACSTSCPAGQTTNTACSATMNLMCKACRSCASGFYETGACSTQADRVCSACRSCVSGEYESSPCTSTANRACMSCSTCSDGNYVATPCGGTSDTACAACTALTGCADIVCTTNSDSVCRACNSGYYLQDGACIACSGACNTGFYQTSACTTTADRVCSACSGACAAGSYESAACSTNADRVCDTCFECGTGFFETGACTPTSNRMCQACTPACTSGFYETVACMGTVDRTCTACTTCNTGFYETRACSTTANRLCQACTPCVDGQTYASTPCGVTSNSICSGCSTCSAGQYVSSVCNVTHNTICSVCTGVANCASVTCTSNSNSACQQCNSGFYLQGGACLACTSSCNVGFYRTAACSATADIQCQACSGCIVGQTFASTPCGTSTDTVCSPCSSCSAGKYVATACTATQNTTCALCAPLNDCASVTCTTSSNSVCGQCNSGFFVQGGVCNACTPGCNEGFYQTVACGGSSNLQCSVCSGCIAGQTFASTPCGISSNTVCSPCSSCSNGQYISAACTATQNTTCATCSGACAAGSYESAACSTNADRVCDTCTPLIDCISVTCTNSTDSVCTQCNDGFYVQGGSCQTCTPSCNDGFYQTGACGGSSDLQCSDCTICPSGQYASTACSPTQNAVCSECTPITTCASVTCTSNSNSVCQECDTGFLFSQGEGKCIGIGDVIITEFQIVDELKWIEIYVQLSSQPKNLKNFLVGNIKKEQLSVMHPTTSGGDVIVAPGSYAYGVLTPSHISYVPAGVNFIIGPVGSQTFWNATEGGDEMITLFEDFGSGTITVQDFVSMRKILTDPDADGSDIQGVARFFLRAGYATQLGRNRFTDPPAHYRQAHDYCFPHPKLGVKSTLGSANSPCAVADALLSEINPDDVNGYVEIMASGGLRLSSLVLDVESMSLPPMSLSLDTLRMPMNGFAILTWNGAQVSNFRNADFRVSASPFLTASDVVLSLASINNVFDMILVYQSAPLNLPTLPEIPMPSAGKSNSRKRYTGFQGGNDASEWMIDTDLTPSYFNLPTNFTDITSPTGFDSCSSSASCPIDVTGTNLHNGIAFASPYLSHCVEVTAGTSYTCYTTIKPGFKGDVSIKFAFFNITSNASFNYRFHTPVNDMPGQVGWCGLQTQSVNVQPEFNYYTQTIYGQIYQPGITTIAPVDNNPSDNVILAQIGWGAFQKDPRYDGSWKYVRTYYNTQVSNNYEFQNGLRIFGYSQPTYSFVMRVSLDGGLSFSYCDYSNTGGASANSPFTVDQLGVINNQIPL